MDSLFVQSYRQLTSYYPGVHTGTHYLRTMSNTGGHPYFGTNAIEYGKITIENFEFSHIPLIYDIYDDVLVSITPAKGQRTMINSNRISAFEMADGSRFVKLDANPGTFFHRNGFYREIIKDEVSLYCKDFKLVLKDNSPLSPLKKYVDNQRFFYKINNEFFLITKKKEAFRMLNLNKREVRPQLKSRRLRFRKHKEEFLKVLVTQSNQNANK